MSSLRPPSRFSAGTLQDSLQSALDYEVAAEKASSLGYAGAMVQEKLQRLRTFQGEPADRLPLVKDAANAVWGYFIQRELCGLRRHDDAIREYGIPREVLAQLGAR